MNIAVCDDDEITLKEVSRAIKGSHRHHKLRYSL